MGIGLESNNLRNSSRFNDPFFNQVENDEYAQLGLRDVQASPMQGYMPSSREAARAYQYAILQPSQWRSSLGLDNQAQTDYRYGSGGYSTPGSVRGRTGQGGFELFNPTSSAGYVQPYVTDNAAFGGNESTYEFNYGLDTDPTTIARSGRIGGVSSDQSGVSTAQSQYELSDPYNFSDSGSSRFGDYGGGAWTDQGNVEANLQPGSGKYVFNNEIARSLKGSGSSTTKESSSGGGQSLSNAISDVGSTGQLENKLTSLGITAAGKLAGMGVSSALTAANLAMLSNPATALIGLATLPISYFGGKAVGRLTSNYRKDKFTDTKSTAESGLSSLTGLGLEGPGSLDFNKYSTGEAGVQTPSNSGYGMTASDVYNSLNQRGKLRVGPEATGNIGLLGDVGGVSDTLLREHEIEKKSAGNWSPNKSYSAEAGSAQSQQATLLGQAGIENRAQMARQSVPNEWVSQNLDPNLVDNFNAYKDRYPNLYGNYSNIDDFITREYFRQNPQAAAEFEMQSNVDTVSNATATSPYGDVPFDRLDYRKAGNQAVEMGGNISMSGPGGAEISNLADVTTNQTTTAGPEFFGQRIGYNTSSTIDANLNSQLNATLKGAGAQAEAVNQMKFNFNNDEYGATLKLNAQRFINDLEQQLPASRDSQIFIDSLRNNPELTALFEQGLPPETIVKASMDYDNINKQFSNTLEWDRNQNYQQAQVYDPTPEQPNSGDEISLANIFGEVRQLEAGKLYDIGYKDVINYSTDYKLPTPLTNQSNEYLADTYNWNKELADNMYYFTPGQNEAYNALANEFINRRYDLTDQFDTSLTDQYLSQIGQEGFDLGNYSLEDFQNIQNLLQQERQFDISPEQQAYEQYQTALGDWTANTPTDYTAQLADINKQLSDLPRLSAEQEYLQMNPDVATAPYFGSNPWAHYSWFGQHEGRAWNPTTDRDIQINQLETQRNEYQTEQDIFNNYSSLKPEEVLDPRNQGRMSQEYYLPETVNISPGIISTIEGVGGGKYKGFWQDPRISAGNIGNADVLEKYFDYGGWSPGQKLQNELAYIAGLPSQPTNKIDPVTGQALTAQREMTPEEFAQTQVTRGKTVGDIASANMTTPEYTPQYETRYRTITPYPWAPWYTIQQPYQYDVGRDNYNNALNSYNALTQSQAGAEGGIDKYYMQPSTSYVYLGFGRMPITTYTPKYDTNYGIYQQALNQDIQKYLAQNNSNSPV